MIKNSQNSYGSIAKTFHWLMFLIIIGMLSIGIYMTGLPNTPDKFELYGLHKSFGVTVLALVILRVLWRFYNTTPTLPKTLNKLQKIAAHASHLLLYVLMFVIPLSGWLMSNSAGHKVVFFGLFDMPDLITKDKKIAEFFNSSHEYLAYTLIALLVIHITAALFHHFGLKDNILKRMLP